MQIIIDNQEYILVKKSDILNNPKVMALDVRFQSDIGANETIREYLYQLLKELWREKDGFSAKRPFGNSGWEYDVYTALVDAGYIDAVKSDSGKILHVDESKADEFVLSLIRYIFYPNAK